MPGPTLQQLEQDPRFKVLPYEAQMRLRLKWFGKNIATSEQFTDLDTAGKSRIFQRIALRPPITEDPLQTAEMKGVWAKYLADDEYAYKWIGQTSKAGIINRNLKMVKIAAKIANPLLSAVYGHDFYDTFYGKDARKRLEWINTLADVDARAKKVAEATTVPLSVGTSMLDMVGWTTALGTSPFRVIGMGRALMGTSKALATKALGKKAATSFGTWLTDKAATTVGISVAGGLTNMARESTDHLLGDTEGQKVVDDLAKAFGYGAAFSMLYYSARGLLGLTKIPLRILRWKPLGRKPAKPTAKGVMRTVSSPEDVAEMTKNLLRYGGALPEGVQMTNYARNVLEVQRAVAESAKEPLKIALGSFKELQVLGNVSGRDVAFKMFKGGRIKAWNAIDHTRPILNFADISAARTWLAERLMDVEATLDQGFIATRVAEQSRFLKGAPATIQDPTHQFNIDFDEGAAKGILDEKLFNLALKLKNSPDFYGPAPLAGGVMPSDRIIARSIVEEGLVGNILKDVNFYEGKLQYDEVLKAVENLQEHGYITYKEAPTVPADHAWWHWVDRGNYISYFREFVELPETHNKLLGPGNLVNPSRLTPELTQAGAYTRGKVALEEKPFARALKGEPVLNDMSVFDASPDAKGFDAVAVLNPKHIVPKPAWDIITSEFAAEGDQALEFARGSAIQRGIYTIDLGNNKFMTLTKNQTKLIHPEADIKTGIVGAAPLAEGTGRLKVVPTGKYHYPDGAAEDLLSRMIPGASIEMDPSRRVLIQTPDMKTSASFPNRDALMDFLVDRSGNFEQLISALKQQDIPAKAIPRADGTYQVTFGPKDVFNAKDIPSALQEIRKRFPQFEMSLPERLMPSAAIHDPTMRGAIIRSAELIGSRREIGKYLNKFAGLPEEHIIRLGSNSKNTLEINNITEKYRVYFGDLDYFKETNSFAEAKQLLNKTQMTLGLMEEAANSKGMELYYDKGLWKVTDVDGRTFVAKKYKDLLPAIKDMASPQSVPEMIDGITREDWLRIQGYMKPYKEFFKDMDPVVAERGIRPPKMAGKLPFGMPLYATFEVPELNMVRIAQGYSEPELMDHFQALREALRGAVASDQTMRRDLFKPAIQIAGRQPKPPELKAIGRLMFDIEDARGKADIPELLKKHDLREEHYQVVSNVRNIMGLTPDQGLAKVFGLTHEKYRLNYLSRIRQAARSKQHAVDIDDVFVGGLPAEVHPFFEFNRSLDESVDLATEENVYEILSNYAYVGNRKRFLNEPMRKFVDYCNTKLFPKLKDDKVSMMVIQDYASLIMGVHQTRFKANMVQFTQQIMDRMGRLAGKSRKGTEDITNLLLKNSYASYMGISGFLPLRNMLQIWTHLGSWYGFSDVWEAMSKVMNDKHLDDRVRELYNRGLLREHLSLVAAENLGKGKVFGLAMTGFQISDVLERVIGIEVAYNNFDLAMDKVARGLIKEGDWKTFADISKIDRLPWYVQNSIQKELIAKRPDVARDTYAKAADDFIFFDYTKEATPTFTKRSVLGKFAGQYGTYSAFTRRMVNFMWRFFPGAKKYAAIARWMGSTMAVYGALKLIFGLEARNLMFFNSVTFNGGPLFKLLMTGVQAFGTDYRARQARSELKSAGRTLIPYHMAATVPGKMLKMIEKGDYYGALMMALRAPYRPRD